MTKVNVRGGVNGTIERLDKIRAEAPVKLNDVVRDGTRAGTTLAKQYASRTSGKHAKKYPATITPQMNRPRKSLFGGNIFSGSYGPEARGQGLLGGILENGSRNNPAHLNLARSADVIGPQFPREVGDVIDGLFW